MQFNVDDFKAFLSNVIVMIEEQKDYLSELDRKIGDGDHGVTMSIGWQAISSKLNSEYQDINDLTKLSLDTGKTFLNAVGSSVGPLYATGFMRGAKAIQGKETLDDQDLYNYWIAFINGIKERGGAEVGDKTMMDTLLPALDVLKQQQELKVNFKDAFTLAVAAAHQGMESTKELESKRGRSSRLGERSIGHQDPGATSSYLILKEFQKIIN